MAFESYYWKKDIRRDISYIQKKMNIKIQNLPDDKFDEHFSKIEIKLFLMAFSIRKLLESQKLPNLVKNMELKCIKYKRNSKTQSLISDYEKLYDFDSPIKTTLKSIDLSNQFIHSHFFQALSNRNGYIRTIFVTSDYQREHCLYSIEIKDFLLFISKISKMQVMSIYRTYDKNTGKIISILK
jgi:penicillin-binding protein-related factor A (putative recombinase)